MDRRQLQMLAEERAADARVLLDAERWAAAYYLAGYAVECGLKAVLLRHLGESDVVFRDKAGFEKLAKGCYTHDLAALVQYAGLEADFGVARGADPALDQYWTAIKDWSETSRYQLRGADDATALIKAVTDPDHGVLQWIRTRFQTV